MEETSWRDRDPLEDARFKVARRARNEVSRLPLLGTPGAQDVATVRVWVARSLETVFAHSRPSEAVPLLAISLRRVAHELRRACRGLNDGPLRQEARSLADQWDQAALLCDGAAEWARRLAVAESEALPQSMENDDVQDQGGV